jgi:VIT1/CCC1 family predicted Fe2+/Mn2+ transporter
MKTDPRRFLKYLDAERNASLLYRALAETVDGERREAFLELADMEDKHASHWIEKLNEYGVDIPAPPTTLDPDDAQVVARARSLGLDAVLDHLEQAEGADAGMYDDEPEALATMPSDEREHAERFRSMRATPAPATETWHRNDRSGAVRAAVFGISDGLVSNTALVMGFAGAATGSRVILLAGLAGLLAGAFSMAAGEYVSVASQRDLYRREIDREAQELAANPEEEQRELELIYRAKGLDRQTAKETASQIMRDPKVALETLAREELGLDPDELGSPVKAAGSSFIAFAIGAIIVVLPYLFGMEGTAAIMLATGMAAVAMLVVGGVVGYLSGRGVLFSAFRQIAWGAGAAAVTFVVGHLIGINIT